MAEHGGKAPPKKGAEKKSGGGFWSFLGDALRSVSIDVDVGAPGRPGAPSGNPTDPASRMEPVRSERQEAYQETIYRRTEGGDGIAPAVRVDRDRRAIARSLDSRVGAQAEPKVPKGSGSPLSRDVRTKMEPRLGSDLSNVRVHTGSDSAQAATDLGARAFTVGSDVHFNAGEHAPGTKEGDRLLAHELTHVVQGQRSGIQRKAEDEGGSDEGAHGEHGGHEVSQPNEPAEKEADHVADKVADNLHGDKKKEGGGEHGDGKQAAGAAAKGGHGGADVKQAAAPISAKLHGVGRKIFRKPAKSAVKNSGKPAESGGNPNFERDAQSFEAKLGPLAFGRGAAAGPALITKVRAYILAKCGVDSMLSSMDKLKDSLQGLIPMARDGAVNAGIAGGVATPEDVQELLMSSEEIAKAKESAGHLKNIQAGNLREQMTIVCNFGNLLNQDLLNSSPADQAKVAEFIKKADLSKKAISDRKKRLEGAQKKAGPGKTPDWGDQPAGHIPDGDNQQQQAASGALREQRNTRLAKNPGKGRDGKKDPRAADRSKEGKPGDPSQTDLTPKQMQDQGMGLSDREKRAQGNPDENARLKWSEGVKTWALDQDHRWSKAQQKLGIPLGAGPSGTTNMLMNTGKMLGGVDTLAMRMACVGYLLPIHAHSLVEILTAAAAHGVPFSSGLQMYRDIKPISEDELRSSCGRSGGKDGKNLFPDEKTPK
jgi:hypothetical protein